MSLELIRQVEERAARAWPAAVVEIVDGWWLRFNRGATRRANSVWPHQAKGRVTLVEKMERVEAFYAGRGLPVRYQMCPACQPSELDSALEARGYLVDAPVQVQTAPLPTVLGRLSSRLADTITIDASLDEAWFSAYCRAEDASEHGPHGRRDILQRIALPTGYAMLRLEGRPAAVGLGVLEQGWLGVYCMATHPEYRRRGAATAVLRSLASWASGRGATRTYLQVTERNVPARALYERAGFETLYGYYYRQAKGQMALC
jgi:ribosomal protein S18 acetylase RimI-like enzyme